MATSARRRLLPHLIALTIYAALAVLVTWPIAACLRCGVVGEVAGVDAYQDAWSLWWNAEALRHGHLPFFAPIVFYPQGVDLFWQTLNFSQGLTALPATLWLGPLAAYNLTVLLSFIIGGYATFLLARHITRSSSGALVAGAIFAFSPYHIDKVVEGSLPLISIHWLPCYTFVLFLLLERPNWRRALLAGLLLIWVGLGSWYYGMFSLLFTGCMVGVFAFNNDRATWWRAILWGSAPVLIWVVLLAPKLLDLAREGDQALMNMSRLQISRSADLLDFFLINPRHPWWGTAVTAARAARYPDAIIWNVALGWVGLLLAVVGGIALWRQAWRWVILLVTTMILAMGPVLHIGGYNTNIPLPFALIQGLPGIRAGQRPNHMAVLSILMLAVLAAFGVTKVTQRLSAHAAWLAVIALVLAIGLIDGYAGPLTIVRRPPHPFYAALPAPDGALLPLPAYVNINRSENLTAQMAHGWPIIGGYVARPPRYPFATYTPGIRELQDAATTTDDIVQPGWPESARQALAAYAIRYITLDFTSDKEAYFRNVQGLLAELGMDKPIAADERLAIYAVPRTWEARPILMLGAGWQALESQPKTAYRWRWMSNQADIRLYNPSKQRVITTLTIKASSYQDDRPLHLFIDEKAFGELIIRPDQVSAQKIIFLLDPGEHTLKFTAPAASAPDRAGATISVRVFELSAQFRELRQADIQQMH